MRVRAGPPVLAQPLGMLTDIVAQRLDGTLSTIARIDR